MRYLMKCKRFVLMTLLIACAFNIQAMNTKKKTLKQKIAYICAKRKHNKNFKLRKSFGSNTIFTRYDNFLKRCAEKKCPVISHKSISQDTVNITNLIIILDPLGHEDDRLGEMCSLLVQGIDELITNANTSYAIIFSGSLLRQCCNFLTRSVEPHIRYMSGVLGHPRTKKIPAYLNSEADLFVISSTKTNMSNFPIFNDEKSTSLNHYISQYTKSTSSSHTIASPDSLIESIPSTILSMMPKKVHSCLIFGHGDTGRVEDEKIAVSSLPVFVGIPPKIIIPFIKVLNDARIRCGCFYTCFGGGLPRRFFEKILHDMEAQFAAVSFGMNELGVRACLLEDVKLHEKATTISAKYPYNFQQCFMSLQNMMKNLDTARTPDETYAFCSAGLKASVWFPTTHSNQQPFIRFPKPGARFLPVPVDPKVMLTSLDTKETVDAKECDAIIIQELNIPYPITINSKSHIISCCLPLLCDDKIPTVTYHSGITHTLERVVIHLKDTDSNIIKVILNCFVLKNISFNKTFKIKELVINNKGILEILRNIEITIHCLDINVFHEHTNGRITIDYEGEDGHTHRYSETIQAGLEA